MITTINGQPSDWSDPIKQEFTRRVVPRLRAGEVITHANYHTPRPYRNEYDRGDDQYGFVYTLNGRCVAFVKWKELK